MKESKLFLVSFAFLTLCFVLVTLSSQAQYTKLYDLTSTTTGASPYGSLVYDGTYLYGMTDSGGTNYVGNIFKIKPDGTDYTVLLNFNGTNGSGPQGSLIFDSTFTFLYGITVIGGANNDGVIFRIKPDGTGDTVLFNFIGAKGEAPTGSLIFDGNFLYGLTSYGGKNNFGTVFKIKPDGTGDTVLFSFDSIHGKNPYGSLISDSAFLYGMTPLGGINNVGTIFKIKPDGTAFDTLMSFNNSNGNNPLGSLISDGTFLYGMTQSAGKYGAGTIVKIKPDGTWDTVLFNFNSSNGNNPTSSLFYDGTFLYGTTFDGGGAGKKSEGYGNVFKIMPDGTGYADLLNFNITKGQWPYASLISDGTFLYGTTLKGGANGSGVIFKIKPDGTGDTTLFNFNGTSANGLFGSLISDGIFLYGMTQNGGTNNDGTVFKIKPDGTGNGTLLNFTGINGRNPTQGSLVYDGTFLYGMTQNGGTNSGIPGYNTTGLKGYGTIFKIMPDGTGYDTLLNFNSTNGANPYSSLYYDGTSFLYGMTTLGGANDDGIIFKIKTDGTGYDTLMNFNSTKGSNPLGSLVSDGTFLYGMTSAGGAHNSGNIFKIKLDGSGYADLMDFDNSNGDAPYGSMVLDGTYLYGMTSAGGTRLTGNLFKIKTDGTGDTTLLNFTGTNGESPYGSLIYDSVFLYGMTYSGGKNNDGTIFKIKHDGTGYADLYDFTGAANGSNPHGSLFSDGTFLYGMTSNGGINNDGIIFKYEYCAPVTSNRSDTVCIGQSITVGTHTYTTTGTFTDTLNQKISGCDSIITTHLIVGCVTGIPEYKLPSINIYPNPSRGIINLNTGQLENVQVTIYTVLGESIYQHSITSSNYQIDLSAQPNGIYFIKLITQQGTVNKKIVISH